MRFRVVATLILAASILPHDARGGTRFVRGGSGVFSTYAIIERNGVEYKTNEVPQVVNGHLWAELNDADRRALIKVYEWRIGRRIDDFGKTTSDQMASWIDADQGWTPLVDALKAKHANKEFPALAAVFGTGLVLPDYSCANAEVVNSAEYKEAARLAKEIALDYSFGQGIYVALVNAQWDQIGVAVKAISEDLINIIVDNLMVGPITNGASKTSELVAQVLDPVKDKLRDLVLGRIKPGSPPPDPVELIAMLDGLMADLEAAATEAAGKVQSKQSRLSALAASLKQRDAEATQRKSDAAASARANYTARVSARPPGAVPPEIKPRNPEASAADQLADVGIQAREWLQANVYTPMIALRADKATAVTEVREKYSGLFAEAGWTSYDGGSYLADASDGFGSRYYEVMDKLSDVDKMIATDYPALQASFAQKAAKLQGAPVDVDSVIAAVLPRINTLDALNKGMDVYATAIGFVPSETNTFSDLRDFGSLVDMAATTQIKAEDFAADYTHQSELVADVLAELPKGVTKRHAWMSEVAWKFESVRFNWENSISFVIAYNRQIERLHTNPYFKRAEFPSVCYSGICVYRYSVDVAGINATVAAKATPLERRRARIAIVAELTRLADEESRLLQLLEIAQKSHEIDNDELNNFMNSVYARCNFGDALAEFAAAGHPLKSVNDLYSDLVPDVTYYNFGDGNWVRNRSLLQSDVRAALPKVSGKIAEYYELLNLYNSMGVERSRYLGMTLYEFNAFMTDSTTKISSTYPTAFQMAGVYGVEWPCWQLLMKTNWRLEELNALYRGYPPLDPVAWDIEGTVRTAGGSSATAGGLASHTIASGVGVPDVDIVLDGYLTESAKSDSSGRFRFTWIGSGAFNATASGRDYQFDQPTNVVTVAGANVTTSFTARETAGSGYFVAGRVTDAGGSALQGITVSLTSSAGDLQQSTAFDGTFSFDGVAPGSITIRPVSNSLVFTPATRSDVLSGSSLTGFDFTAAPGTPKPGLSVTITGTGTGTVTATGINCPPVCYGTYDKGTAVNLTASPTAGARFVGWFGRCAGIGGCNVTMDEVMAVAAQFDAPSEADTLRPTITAFSLPAISSSLQVALSFSAIDDVGVAGYLVSSSPTLPAASDPRWTASAPGSYTFSGIGRWTLYGWAKDAAGNVAAAVPAMVTIPFAGGPPAGLVANATSPSSVSLSWSGVAGATTYAIERKAPGGIFQVVTNSTGTAFVDGTVSPALTYVYRVSAGANGQYSAPSAPALATTIVFTDSPLTWGTLIRATHLAELRNAIGLVRQLAGLGAYPFTDSAVAGTTIRAAHVTEMRTALEQACSHLGLPGYSYLDGSLAGTHVKATHFQQLRDRMQ